MTWRRIRDVFAAIGFLAMAFASAVLIVIYTNPKGRRFGSEDEMSWSQKHFQRRAA